MCINEWEYIIIYLNVKIKNLTRCPSVFFFRLLYCAISIISTHLNTDCWLKYQSFRLDNCDNIFDKRTITILIKIMTFLISIGVVFFQIYQCLSIQLILQPSSSYIFKMKGLRSKMPIL